MNFKLIEIHFSGGIWKSFNNAKDIKAKSFALFLRNQRQWAAKPLDEATTKQWKDALKV